MLENILQKIWYRKNICYLFLSILILPFSILYLLIFYIKKSLTIEKKFNTPIICFGNINVGGTGKTSTLLSLLPELKKIKPNLVVLLRGYKGSIKSIHKVDTNFDTSHTVGDEALMYAKIVKTFVSSDRSRAIKEIIKSDNPELIVLDDGLQDKRVKKNKNIILINGRRGFGNNLLLPSGPLREIPSLALKESDIIILIGEDSSGFEYNYRDYINKKNLFKGKIISLDNGLNKNFLAFCGIGNNESFFNTLKNNNYNVVKKLSFPDHYQYNEKEIKELINESKQNNLIPITTEKDINRISAPLKNQIRYLKIKILIDNKDDLVKNILEF